MMKILLLCLLGTFLSLPGAAGYASGGPRSSCDDMTPTHGRQPSSISPYTLDLNGVTTYKFNKPIDVYIEGRNAYQGIFMQARNGTNSVVGQWTRSVPNTKTRTCFGRTRNTITNSNSRSKPTGKTYKYTWYPPSSDSGKVYIQASVLLNEDIWWTNIRSELLSLETTTTTTTTKPPTTTTTTTKPPTTTTTTTKPPTTTTTTTTKPPTTTTTTTKPPTTTTTRPPTTTTRPPTTTTTRPPTTTTTRPPTTTTTKPPTTTTTTTTPTPPTTITTKASTTTTKPPTTTTAKPSTTANTMATTHRIEESDPCKPNPCQNMGICVRRDLNDVIDGKTFVCDCPEYLTWIWQWKNSKKYRFNDICQLLEEEFEVSFGSSEEESETSDSSEESSWSRS